jgi:membrane protein YqaA with SNARE-associated domain
VFASPLMIYLSLFIAAFLAATLLPFSSEVLLSTYVLGGYPPLGLWCAATLGNTLGSVVSWFLGIQVLRWQDRSWFPFKPGKLHRAQDWFDRYGRYSLLFAWVPVVGDPLTFVAGVMRVSFWPFVVLVAIGKGTRYAIIIALLQTVN